MIFVFVFPPGDFYLQTFAFEVLQFLWHPTGGALLIDFTLKGNTAFCASGANYLISLLRTVTKSETMCIKSGYF